MKNIGFTNVTVGFHGYGPLGVRTTPRNFNLPREF